MGEGEKRSVKTPGDHRAMDAIGSIDWKREVQGTRAFYTLLPGIKERQE